MDPRLGGMNPPANPLIALLAERKLLLERLNQLDYQISAQGPVPELVQQRQDVLDEWLKLEGELIKARMLN